MASNDPRRYLTYLAAERDAGRMYRALAELATGERRDALLELAGIEDGHAAHWVGLAQDAGLVVPSDQGALDPTSEALVRRARQLSLDAVLPDLEAAEVAAQGEYDSEPDALPTMAGDERGHAKILAAMRRDGRQAVGAAAAAEDVDGASSPTGSGTRPSSAPTSQRSVAEVRRALNAAEPWHRTDKSGSLRAAVFGVSDGLVSNTALVMGFAGAVPTVSNSTVVFAGFAGLLAGAFSMAAGEFVSVSSQRDLFAREIAVEAQELKDKPLEEQRELELLYRAKGLDRQAARELAAKIMSDPATALDTLAREELGLDPDALGSPVKVAASSFAAFAIGAIVPVVPFLVLSGNAALSLGIALAVFALIVVGSTVGRLSGAGIVKSAARQLLVGAGAAAVTFVIGHLVGGGIG